MILEVLTAALIATAPAHMSAASSSDTLALDWLEREALLRNPTLAARRAAAAEARARARVAGSLADPMFDAGAAPRSFADGDAATPGAYRFGLRQRVPVFGERGLERRSANAEASASVLEGEAARLDLLYQVRLAFFDLYRVERALETNAEQTVLMNQFRRVALSRYAAGTDGQQDPLTADAELGMLAHEEAMFEREHRLARVRLNTLLHREPTTPLPPAPLRVELPSPGDTARASLERRAPWPELRAADARVAAGEARVALAGRRRLPELELGVEYDRFMDEPERRTVAMLGFNLPLFGGRLAAAEAEARAGLARSRAERDAAADAVALHLEEARADYEESLHEVEVLETILVPTSERSLAAARGGYESGRAGFLALMDAARRRATARQSVEDARTRAARGWAALQHAIAADVMGRTQAPADSAGSPPPAPRGEEPKR